MSRPSGEVMCTTGGALAFGMLLLAAVAPHCRTVEAQGQPSPVSLLAASPWPKYRRDERHTGYSPHTGPASNRLKWTFSTGRRDAEGGIETDPVIGPDGTVYLGANNGFLYALDPETRDLRWAFPTGFDTFAIYSTPFVDRQGVVYFGAKDGNVYALRAPRKGIVAEVVWSLYIGPTIDPALDVCDERHPDLFRRPGGRRDPLHGVDGRQGVRLSRHQDGKIVPGAPGGDVVRHLDSGGTGRITLVLVQKGSEIQGILRLQGGARGSLEGKIERDRGSFTLHAVSEKCPGSGGGTVRIEGGKLIGQYRGQDCRGAIEGGTFELGR